MKVLHLLSSDRLSGAENVAVEIIRMFDGTVEMAYSSPGGPIEKSLSARGVKHFPLKKFTTREIKSVVASYQADVIHAHDIRASVQAIRVAGRTPVVSHIHGNHDGMKRITLKSLLYVLASYRIKHIIVVSKSIIEEFQFRSNIIEKTTILYNPIDRKRVALKAMYDTSDHSTYDFIYLGRLSEPKNPKRIANIASRVLSKSRNARFALVGEGDMADLMKSIFDENGVSDRVDFLGFMDNPYGVLSQSRVMIMCSRYEGTPMAALEALSLGVPIVSTPTDGLVDLIENGVNGYICDNDDDFSERVLDVITQRALFERLSQGAKQRSLDFVSLEDYKKTLQEIYSLSVKCEQRK